MPALTEPLLTDHRHRAREPFYAPAMGNRLAYETLATSVVLAPASPIVTLTLRRQNLSSSSSAARLGSVATAPSASLRNLLLLLAAP
ncbi:hypothetical protein B0H14DRAFT_3501176 [Mycena olivaceomarginata]|nr:hypothetical protein B0H14DRAFT_3501176 [Mycena olivaceomarginata]